MLDTKTGEVLAYVGNAEISGKKTAQYVDNVISNRSSGSILKPFLYAAMLNEGELLPNSLVADIPTRFGGYAPENFEKNYVSCSGKCCFGTFTQHSGCEGVGAIWFCSISFIS